MTRNSLGLGSTFIIALGLFLGCKDKPSESDVKEKVGEAVEATTDYVKSQAEKLGFEQKQSLVDQMESEIKGFEAKLKELKDDSSDSEVTERLEEQLSELKDELEDLKKTGEQGWEKARDELAKAYEEAKAAF